MTFLPLPPSFLRQLAEERLPSRLRSPHAAAPLGSHGLSDLRAFERRVVESLELDPELRRALIHRVTRDRATASSVISEALRQYLAS